MAVASLLQPTVNAHPDGHGEFDEHFDTGVNPTSVRTAPVQSNKGSIDDFHAILFMTTDVQKTLESWNNSPNGVLVDNTGIVARNGTIEAIVLFGGCQANDDGNCVAEIDYRIVKPDGSLYAEYKDTELWREKPAVPEGKLGLAVDRVGLNVEPTDPLGTYTMYCVVRDLVAKLEFSIEHSFTVIDSNVLDDKD